MAVSCNAKPRGMDGLFGVTDMEDKVADVTVRVVFAAVLPEVMVIVVVPGFKAIAKPLALTVAIEVFEEVQVT